MLLVENEFAHSVNYVAIVVYKVALMIDFAASRVSQYFAFKTCSIQNDIAFGILLKSTYNIFHIKALSVVVIEFLDIAIIQLLFVELFPAISVNNVSCIALYEPSKAIYSTLLLVDVEALFGLIKFKNGATSALVILVIEVAHQVMWVEIESLEAKRLRYLTLVVKVCGIEKLLPCVVLDDIARILIDHITFFVYSMTSLVHFIS